jgi:hypothetical protein
MAFGQQSGPPASTKQIQQLLALLQEAGHQDFRDGRGPMGFSQRQAGGRFTREEAAAFIDRLEAGDSRGSSPPAVARPVVDERMMRHIPAEQLATELERRGWIVIGP